MKLVNLLILSILSLARAKSPPPCNTIPTVDKVDYQKLVEFSPYDVYSTDVSIYKCAKIVYTGPGYSKVNYTGSAVVIQGNSTFTYDVTLVNNVQLQTVVCPIGLKRNYNVVYYNLTSATQASGCALTCNGTDYEDLVCLGRGPSDFAAIKKFLAKTIPGLPDLKDAQNGCPSPTECNFFTN